MMGSLFTDLIDMLENRYGLVCAQKIIDGANLKNKGAFTAVGYYNRSDLDCLLQSMIQELGGTRQEWLFTLGRYMSEAHVQRNPTFYTRVKSLTEFLLQVNDLAQEKIATLYPDEEVPTFSTRLIDENTIEFIYTSPNRLGELTEGWVTGKAQYFGEKIEISQTPLAEDESKILFLIKRMES